MREIIDYFQLGANGFVLLALSWLYIAYVRTLKSTLELKNEQIKIAEKNVGFWKDKANELKKTSPEFVETVLSKRIQIREEELNRLNEDSFKNQTEILELKKQLNTLHSELEKAKYFSRALTYYDSDIDDDVIIPPSDIKLIELGEVFVDSGSLMITDPCYIDLEWKNVEYTPKRIYKDSITGENIEWPHDFTRYDEVFEPYGKNVNELIADGSFVEIKDNIPLSYSYSGACLATNSEQGCGVLPFKNGLLGAGFAIKTVYGDGAYTVMGEYYKDNVIRIYIDLQ
ncbi:hypothetical protein [uncultured Gilliamella sp.]|uniref:hypothetical protein n=1 Tax=uncultured Gilliamella sp. TaxID=1193505 RepID=UPI0025FDBEA2|nr:hypothetical protein [uncultured Gilliamella sp.]